MTGGGRGEEKEWIDCVVSNVLAFSLVSNWKATTLEVGVENKRVVDERQTFRYA